MVDSDQESSPEIRRRLVESESENADEISQKEAGESNDFSVEEFDEKDVEENEEIDEKKPEVCQPRITVYGGIRNLQPPQRPSFISRQLKNIKTFFAELFDFIFLL